MLAAEVTLVASWCEVIAPEVYSLQERLERYGVKPKYVPRPPPASERELVRAALKGVAPGSLSLCELSAVTGVAPKRIGAALAHEKKKGCVASFLPLDGKFHRYRWLR